MSDNGEEEMGRGIPGIHKVFALEPKEEHLDVEGEDEGDEESAYGVSSSGGSGSDSDYDSDEVVDEAELSDEEEEEEYEEEQVFEERPRKRGRPRKYPLPSTRYAPSTFAYPAGPIMPPLIAATIPMFAKAFSARSPGTTVSPQQAFQQSRTSADGSPIAPDATAPSHPAPQLTAAQFQEFTKSTVNQLAGMTQAAGPKLPLLLPRTPEVTTQIRANVSAELKQNLATMLLNPQYRQMLLQQVQAAQNPNLLHNQRPSSQFTFRQYQSRQAIPTKPRGSSKGKSLALRDLDGETTGEEEGTIAERRPRRTPRKAVSYAKYFDEDVNEEEEEEEVEEMRAALQAKTPKKPSGAPPSGKRGRGRPRKSAIVEEEETYEEGEGEGEDVERLSEEGPTVEKILSKRTSKEGVIEYYVKWTKLSYLHTEWITKDELVACTSNAGTRLTRFDKKPLAAHHFSPEHIFNPAFCIPERILFGWQHPDVEDPEMVQTSYLVKWTSLPVEDSTWEKGSVLMECQDGESLIKEWSSQQTAEEKLAQCLPVGERPDPSVHSTLTESPVYKNGNTLRPYQLEGLNWLLYCWLHRQSCIIADEMGLGKTVQSVAFLDYLYNKFKVLGPFLIVAPLSTLPHWEREFEAWSALKVITYHGSVPSRDVQYEYEFFYRQPGSDQPVPGVCRFDVLITTYEMALAGEAHLRDIVWRVAVFDEAHRLKSKTSKASEVLKGFQVEHKLLLTGTPLQNNLEELWALLNFLQPQRFFSEEEFREQYGQLRRSEDVQRLQELLKPLMLRRLKEDVEKSIPVKEETIVEVELTSLQKRYYRAILERNFAFLMQGTAAKNAPGLLNTMMELRKCCIHPYLIQGAESRILEERGVTASRDRDEVMSVMIQASGKLVLLDKLLARLREGGHRVLIFSQMTRCLDILGDYLRYRHYPFERIDGSIRGEDRQASIDRFCDMKRDAFIFLLCTRAGGVGINLTAADTVIIYDSDWNPQNDIQAQARCHRIGQTKSVKIYRLLTRNTYEREMFDRAGLKLGLDKAVLGQKMADLETVMQHGGSAAPSAMDRKEVETLLKKGAYGLLMEDDEASVRFCEESIDQILERRTTVIKHGDEAGAKTSSIFSKASFAATADQNANVDDIDVDDPMFWERWAQKMQMDPNQLLDSGRGMALLDEPRIKRSVRRIRNDAENLSLSEIFALKTATTTGESTKLPSTEWTEGERVLLLQNVLDHGLSCLDVTKHPHRTRNDLLAAARFILRECLDNTAPAVQFSGTSTPHAHDESKFREDFEKLVIGRVDFDVLDQSLVPMEDRPAPREFPRSEIPYPYASRPQVLAYKSFTDYADSSPQFASILSKHARSIVLRVHLFELVRQFCQLDSGNAPLVPGAGLRDWWTREHDLALLQGITTHGLRAYDAILKADVFSAHPNLPTPDELDERVLKLLFAFERRSRATAKAALTTIHEQRKRVPVFKPTPKPQRNRRRRNVSDEEEEEEVSEGESGGEEYVDKRAIDEMEEEEEGEGSRRKSSRKDDRVYKGTSKSRWTKPRTGIATRWSRRDRNEFMRVVGQFGLPPPTKDVINDDPLVEDAIVQRDWATFLRLSKFATARDTRQLDEFAPLFVTMCRVSAEKRVVVTAVESDEELAVVPADRARKSLHRITTFGKLRSWLADPLLNVQEVLSHSRRTAGLPRWWETSVHDFALLQGIARYGTAQIPWIIGDRELAFWSIYEASVLDSSAETTSRRRSSAKQPAQPTTTDDSGIKPSAINWPTEMVILRRFDQLMEMLANEKSPSPTTSRPLTLKLSRSSTASDLQASTRDTDKNVEDV